LGTFEDWGVTDLQLSRSFNGASIIKKDRAEASLATVRK